MPLREPLKWTGGIRESASGLIVEIATDEGIVGVGEAPGPTLPVIQTIIEREFAQFLVGEDPLRTEWLVHRLEEYSRNWAGDRRLRDRRRRDGAARPQGQGARRARGGAARRLLPRAVPVIGYLFIDEPEANAAEGGRRSSRPGTRS